MIEPGLATLPRVPLQPFRHRPSMSVNRGMARASIHSDRSLYVMPEGSIFQYRSILRGLDPAGRKKLQELESTYRAESGKLKPAKTSVITYILVHERERGLISG